MRQRTLGEKTEEQPVRKEKSLKYTACEVKGKENSRRIEWSRESKATKGINTTESKLCSLVLGIGVLGKSSFKLAIFVERIRRWQYTLFLDKLPRKRRQPEKT